MCMPKRIISLLLCCIFSMSAIAQSFADTHQQNVCLRLYQEICSKYTLYNNSQLITLFEECESCCINLDEDALLLQLMNADSANVYFRKTVTDFIKTDSSGILEMLGNAYSKASFLYIQEYPDNAIQKQKMAMHFYAKLASKTLLASTLQNIAFIYDERLKNKKLANIYALAALQHWKVMHDSTNAANMYKYIGYLYGENNERDKGLAYIDSALVLYYTLGNSMGQAVSYFNRAQVYQNTSLKDSVVYYLGKAKEIWITHDNFRRIYKINNELINEYTLLKKFNKAEKLIVDNQVLDDEYGENIFHEHRIEFYEMSVALYTLKGNTKIAEKYTHMIDSFK